GATEKEAVRREDRSAKSARTSQSHQSYGCASPKCGRRAWWRWARAKRTASSTAPHSEESRPIICAAEEGRLILASELAIRDATSEGLSPAYRQRGDLPSNSAA